MTKARIADKFSRFVARGESCWEWTGSRNANGYGQFQMKTAGRWAPWLAHRVSYWLEKGDVPDGMCVCHSCDNRACVRPDHLWLGTVADNNRDMSHKGRVRTGVGMEHPSRKHPESLPRGEDHVFAKLNDASVREIRSRRDAGEDALMVARMYGVSRTVIYKIHNRQMWAHVS
jgi:hypothetical protein